MTDWEDRGWLTLDELKRTVTIPEVLELLGVEVRSDGKFISPWNPEEHTPSAHAYEDHVFDYSTGRGGDLVDLVQAYHPEMKIYDVVRAIGRKALRCGLEPGHVETTPVRTLVDFTEELGKYILWAHDPRFISLHPPADCMTDGEGGLYIPHRDAEGVYGVKVRGADGSKSAWPGSQFTKSLYDPHGWSATHLETYCVIAEGESDCWALDQFVPGNVYALPSGAQSWKDSWLESLEGYETIYLVLDNDKAGKEARAKLERKIGFLRVKHIYVPDLINDAREAIARGWRPTL